MPKGAHLIKHGLAGTDTHIVWKHMRNRCNNPRDAGFKNYGGRGITICERWDSFANFFTDMGKRPPNHFIDRIDNDGPYSPENCRWATRKTQNRNRRSNVFVTFKGKRCTLAELAEETGVPYAIIRDRIIESKWDAAKAVHEPIGRWNDKEISYRGESRSLAEWSTILGIHVETLRSRLHKLQWPVEKAFDSTPLNRGRRGLNFRTSPAP